MRKNSADLRRALDDSLSWLIRGGQRTASHLLLAPATFWLVVFLVLPMLSLLVFSVAQRGPYGTMVWHFTFSNFSRAIHPKYLPILLRTVTFSATCTALCLLLGYPVAYYLSFFASRWRDRLMVLLMIPFWTSSLVAIYCWIIILGREGLLNGLLLRLGLIQGAIGFLNTPFSVIVGLVYFYIPFMILPLYSSLEKIPRAYIEASYDLGASAPRTFLKITLPLSLPGVFSGCILTFIPCMGDFLTAEFLGGPSTYLLGNLIQNQFLMAQDWPFGAALTVLLLIALMAGLGLYQKVESIGLEKA